MLLLFVSGCREDFHQLEFTKYPSPVIAREGSNASFCVRINNKSNCDYVINWFVAGRKVELPSERFVVSNSKAINYEVNGTS